MSYSIFIGGQGALGCAAVQHTTCALPVALLGVGLAVWLCAPLVFTLLCLCVHRTTTSSWTRGAAPPSTWP